MRKTIFFVLFIFILSVKHAPSDALPPPPDPEDVFRLSTLQYFGLPEADFLSARQKGVPEDEIPVLFFMAKNAKLPVPDILKLRLEGKSWFDISVKFHIGPETFYVPIEDYISPGPPYGNAYGHYRNKPKAQWNTIVLSDGDIINLVNLRFITEHYGKPARYVINLREQDAGFIQIHKKIKEKQKSKEKGPEGKRRKGQGKRNNQTP